MLQSLLSWLNTPVTIRPYLSIDATGDKTYGPDFTAKCYPEFSNKVVVNVSGKEVVSSHTLYFKEDVIVSSDDKILLNGTWFEIKSIGVYYDDVGNVSARVVHI